MSSKELKKRENAMYNWLIDPKNFDNPFRNGVALYAYRLEMLIQSK